MTCTRNEHARHIVTGFASAMPALTHIWQYLEDALVLSAEVTRLSVELHHTRLDQANLLAAIRATLAAQADGEPRPLGAPARRARRASGASCVLAEARVTTYRRLRRQARRGGLQPMMVINSGESFPETADVVLLRWAWRYRSELAPLGFTAVIVCAAWWLHAARPRRLCRRRALSGVHTPAR